MKEIVVCRWDCLIRGREEYRSCGSIVSTDGDCFSVKERISHSKPPQLSSEVNFENIRIWDITCCHFIPNRETPEHWDPKDPLIPVTACAILGQNLEKYRRKWLRNKILPQQILLTRDLSLPKEMKEIILLFLIGISKRELRNHTRSTRGIED